MLGLKMASRRADDQFLRGFDCEFVNPPPPPSVLQTECPICLLIIRDPYQVTCCGKKFCRTCIEQIRESKKVCPNCKENVAECFQDVGLKNFLCAQEIYCTHRKDGCGWRGKLGQLDTHLNRNPEPGKELDGCSYIKIDCFHRCGDQLQRQYMKNHLSDRCIKRPFKCEHCCAYKSTYADVKNNHWPVCEYLLIPCPDDCGELLRRKDILRHLDTKCRYRLVNCSFREFGCLDKICYKDLSKHLSENFSAHMSLLASSHADQQAAIADQRKEIARLEGEINNQRAETQQQKLYLEGELDDQRAEIQQQKICLIEQQTQIVRLTSENKELKKRCSTLQENLAFLNKALEDERSEDIEGSTLATPPILTMTEFSQHKRDEDCWYSSPVYIHHHGYRVCLGVYAAGHETRKHVSVFVHFVCGKFDQSLLWPFRGVISFRLLNPNRDREHRVHSNVYDDKIDIKTCSRVTDDNKGIGRGLSKFISHTEVEDFLQNDTLEFQIFDVQCPMLKFVN